jgi:hypothetical protein
LYSSKNLAYGWKLQNPARVEAGTLGQSRENFREIAHTLAFIQSGISYKAE